MDKTLCEQVRYGGKLRPRSYNRPGATDAPVSPSSSRPVSVPYVPQGGDDQRYSGFSLLWVVYGLLLGLLLAATYPVCMAIAEVCSWVGGIWGRL